MTLLLLGCSEFTLNTPDPVPPATPPGRTVDDGGSPPDWTFCQEGYRGRYFNLPSDHPDVGEEPGEATVDWWAEENLAFARYDPSLDWGESWWPVDEALEGDPDYFSAEWYGWIRVLEDGPVSVVLGVVGDVALEIGEEMVLSRDAVETWAPETVDLDLRAGVEPVRVRYAQRSMGKSGLRFRFSGDELEECYPEYGE